MIHYLIQLIVFQALFLGVYELFLKKETFFSLNRTYLLVTPFLAAIIPLLEFEILQNFVPMEGTVQLPALILSGNNAAVGLSTAIEVTGWNSLTYFLKTNWLLIGYFFGVVTSFVLFLRKYLQLQRLKYSGKLEKHGKTTILRIPESRIACTFFNTIFLGEELPEEETTQILAHEMAHVEQKHSWDLLLFELLRIFLWFDPFIYRYQSQLSVLHEYIADEKVTRKIERSTYFQDLLNSTFGTRQVSFTNQFFNKSLIKKRIMMLQKPKSNRIAKLKFLLIIPLMLVMLAYVACSENEPEKAAFGITYEVYEIIDGERVKTIEVASFEAVNEEKEAEIVKIIQQIGTRYEKVIVTNGETSLVFNTPRWENGFLNKTKDGFDFYADVIKGTLTKEISSDDDHTVPFSAIEHVPIFPGCENLPSSEAAKACMSTKIREFVNANFNTELAKKLGLKGTNRIQVMFTINKSGKVVDVKARAPHPELKAEAIKVISSLPTMVPGKQDGKPVSVLYSLPIIFQVQ